MLSIFSSVACLPDHASCFESAGYRPAHETCGIANLVLNSGTDPLPILSAIKQVFLANITAPDFDDRLVASDGTKIPNRNST